MGNETIINFKKIFDTIQINYKNMKKIVLASLDENARYRNFYKALYFLNDTKLVDIAYNVINLI